MNPCIQSFVFFHVIVSKNLNSPLSPKPLETHMHFRDELNMDVGKRVLACF